MRLALNRRAYGGNIRKQYVTDVLMTGLLLLKRCRGIID